MVLYAIGVLWKSGFLGIVTKKTPMKTRLLISSAFLLIFSHSIAQWGTYSGGTTYHISNSAYKVSIGLNNSTAASEKLHVVGNIYSTQNIISGGSFESYSTNNLTMRTNALTRMTILYSNGNVGIGETSPAEKLHLNGSIRGNQSGALRISSGTGTIDIGSKNSSYGHLDTDRASFLFNKKIVVDQGIVSSFDEALTLQSAGTTGITILTNGNVGIGTTLPANPNTYKLAVNGKIGAKEVQVETTSGAWPDYVFESTYQLMPLSSVASYIKANKHLPEVPSATEIETNGHKLGEMDAILLKKVEELTLYMIELKKENDALKLRVQDLEAKRD